MNLPDNERLGQRLKDFFVCAEDVLSRLYTDNGYNDACTALCWEVDELNTTLTDLSDRFHEELPLESEEPKNIGWMTAVDVIRDLISQFLNKKSTDDVKSSTVLVNRLDTTCSLLENIDTTLFPESDSDIYASYSKRELAEYIKFKWNRTMRGLRIFSIDATTAHEKDAIRCKLEKCQQEIRSISEYILSKDNKTIYHEALGRYIWKVRHLEVKGKTVDEILCLVKSMELYANKLGEKLTFLDRESSPAEETDEAVRLENLRQETLQHQKQVMLFRIGKCESYFKEYDEKFFDDMIEAMINSEHSFKVCDKMKERKILKFIHQVIGVIKDKGMMIEGCSYGELANALAYNCDKPSKDSRIDYMRKGIDDAPEIQKWIVKYIDDNWNLAHTRT